MKDALVSVGTVQGTHIIDWDIHTEAHDIATISALNKEKPNILIPNLSIAETTRLPAAIILSIHRQCQDYECPCCGVGAVTAIGVDVDRLYRNNTSRVGFWQPMVLVAPEPLPMHAVLPDPVANGAR